VSLSKTRLTWRLFREKCDIVVTLKPYIREGGAFFAAAAAAAFLFWNAFEECQV
jgi:hypothetical protein